jgi:hypothetical protein
MFPESEHHPVWHLGKAELSLFLCVNEEFEVVTVNSEALRDGFLKVNVKQSPCRI